MSKRFLLILVACALVLGGIFWLTRDKANAPASNVQPSEHVLGTGNKGVRFIEYGDFQCPACFGYEPLMQELRAKYKEDIFFQFRNFPLVQLHPNAMAGHRAAEAAHLQGKFWEMHDLLYEQQQSWATSNNASAIFESYARELGLNLEKYKQDVNSTAVSDVINADVKAAQALGASATPTFVLNGKRLEENPRDVDSFSKLIDAEIQKNNQ